jgi:hypothetical protein
MAINVTFKASSATFGATTWNTTTGGTIEVGYTHSGRVEENRVGDDEYPTVVAVPDRSCMVTVTLRTVKSILPLNGTPAALSFIITGRTGVTVTVSFPTMVLVSVGGTQRRGEFGSCVLTFAHQSALGVANPVS